MRHEGIERDEETFELGPEDEAALLEAIAEGDRGEVVSAEEFLRQPWTRNA